MFVYRLWCEQRPHHHHHAGCMQSCIATDVMEVYPGDDTLGDAERVTTQGVAGHQY